MARTSEFAGLRLFESGPHTFVIRAMGRAIARPRRDMNAGDVTEDYGLREVEIEQRGRLCAEKMALLEGQLELIRHHVELGTKGDLVDHFGTRWPGMSLLSFRAEGPVVKGRVFSVSYVATYIRMGSTKGVRDGA